MSNKLGEILIELGLLEKANLVRALKAQHELGDKLGDILIKLGMIKEEERVKALSTQLDLPMIEKSDFPSEPLFTSKISANFLKKSKIIPLSEDLESIALAMADPLDQYAVEAMSMLSGKKVKLYIGMEKDTLKLQQFDVIMRMLEPLILLIVKIVVMIEITVMKPKQMDIWI